MAPSRALSLALLRSLRSLAVGPQPASRSITGGNVTNTELGALQSDSPLPPPIESVTASNPEEATSELLAAFAKDEPHRRRMAIQQTSAIPFDQLPYQCFQEAWKVLTADRAEKLVQIEKERQRILRLRETDPSQISGGAVMKERRLKSMDDYLNHLKIFADINDPNVKRRFEDGKGDMNKPIYRHLAEKKWRDYRRKIQVQRIETMHVVPDVLPECNPVVDITFSFEGQTYTPGDYVLSNASEHAPSLNVQSFAKGERLFTIVAIDPDVPQIDLDKFGTRCHFFATNISITPSQPTVDLANLAPDQVIFPWLPPSAQKGSPYHRVSIVLLQQHDNVPINRDVILKYLSEREPFSARKLMRQHMLVPIGATLFRTQWDEHTASVMARHNIPGADIELKRKKVEALPYKRRNPSSFR